MEGLLALALMVVGLAAASSLLLCLPVMVAAESLVGRDLATARRFWHMAAALPLLLGLFLTALALLTQTGDIAASPHQERIRPHLCLALLTGTPDAAFRFQLYGVIAVGLLAFALIRLLSGIWRARAVRGRTGILEVDTEIPLCFSVGLTRPVIVCSTALRQLLSEAERAAVLAHERVHAKYRDTVAELWLRLATDPLLWIPTTHYYLRQARAARELLCDAEAAAVTSTEALTGALQKLQQAATARHQHREGDLAGLKPVFPDYADPARRLGELSGRMEASLAPHLVVVLVVELLVAGILVAWQWRPLHDTLHCLAQSVLTVMQR